MKATDPTLKLRLVQWNRITLVGVGLLGGSLGQALRQRRLAGEVVGYVRRAASVNECRGAGAVDAATRDLLSAVTGAELVVLCTPIGRMRLLVEQMLPALRRGTIVTDVGSVKGSVVRELEPLLAKAGAHFIGSHPMAGAEKLGVGAARPDLFVDAVCVVTPTRRSNRAAQRKVQRLWEAVGGRVLALTPEKHDALVSQSSHLPHLLAVHLVNFVLGQARRPEQGRLCANGFRDTTRIASGSPEMWRDIALTNRKNLVAALDAFTNELRKFRRVLKQGDVKTIAEVFVRAKERRDQWLQTAPAASSE